MTKEQKIQAAGNCPEIMMAAKMLLALKQDIKAKNFVCIGYEFEGEYYQLIFRKPKIKKVKHGL